MRNPSVDLLRCAGIIAIVAGHVWTDYPPREYLYGWHVPVFFFLTGFLWTTGRTLEEEVRRRSRSLLKPYAFWFVILYVAHVIRLVEVGELTPPSLVGPVYGGYYAYSPFSTFWFVFVLFASALLWRLLERYGWGARAAVLSIAILASIFVGPLLAKTPLAIGSALPALVFVAAGQIAKHWSGNRAVSLSVCVGGVVAATLFATQAVNSLDIKQGDWGTPFASMICAILVSWGLLLAAQRIAPMLGTGRFVTRLATTGFTVILLHPLVLQLTPMLSSPLQFAFALLIPGIVALFALRTSVSQWVTGMPAIHR